MDLITSALAQVVGLVVAAAKLRLPIQRRLVVVVYQDRATMVAQAMVIPAMVMTQMVAEAAAQGLQVQRPHLARLVTAA